MKNTSESDRSTQMRAGRRLEYLTIGWTALEAGVGLWAGLAAGSVALVGFGADSVIEVASGAVLLWRLQNLEGGDHRETIARWFAGISLLALAAYVAWDAGSDLFRHAAPRISYLGLGLAVAAVIVMPSLARGKRRVAVSLDSAALHADSHQSAICAYLSLILLVGIGWNALFGWWWADPVAALGMVPIIIKEGIDALRGEECC